MHSTQYTGLYCRQYPLAAANIHGISEHGHNVLQSTLSALMGAKCKMIRCRTPGGRGLTLCLVWSLVTGWIKAMNIKTCICFLLTWSIFTCYSPLFVFYVLQPPSPQHERYHWELSAKFIGKFGEVFSFRRILKRITRPTLHSSEKCDITNTENQVYCSLLNFFWWVPECVHVFFCGICNLFLFWSPFGSHKITYLQFVFIFSTLASPLCRQIV